VKAGSKYVLYDGTTKTVSPDDQKPSVRGSQGKVTGIVVAATKTIHVASIKAAS
jgi:hypothetical protein